MTDPCAKCGQTVDDRAQACPHCGAVLSVEPVRAAAGWGGLEHGAAAHHVPARPRGGPVRPPSASAQSQVMARARAVPGGPAPVAPPDAEPHTGWGMVDDPLAQRDQGPSLELASVPPPGRKSRAQAPGRGGEDDPSEAPKPKPLSRKERRCQRIQEISGFGKAATSIVQVVPYFVRVFLRRRVVAEELAELSLVRKRAEAKLADALCEVGQALYLRRADPALAPLARHAAIVADTESQLDAGQARSQDAQRDATELMQDIHQRLEAAEQAAAPVKKRAGQLQAKLATLEARSDEAEGAVRACDRKIAKLQAKKTPEPTDVEVLEQLSAERADANGQLQSTQLLVHPVREEMQKVQARVRKHQAVIAEIEAERDRQSTIAEREQARHARQTGDARHALQAALTSLAQAGIQQGLAQACQRLVEAVGKLEKDVGRKREREGLHREALSSYDDTAYRRGLFGLVGGTGAVFLTSLLLIVL